MIAENIQPTKKNTKKKEGLETIKEADEISKIIASIIINAGSK